MSDIRFEIQQKARDSFIDNKCKGILNIAQRVGKVKCTIEILKKLFNYSPTVLICYPDNKIKDSFLNDFEKWSYKSIENITFCNYSSIWKYEDRIFDLLVLDECHTLSEREMSIVKEMVKYNPKVLGLSGTISKDTEKELKSIGLPIIFKYSMERAIKDEIISDYEIRVHLVNLDTKIKTPNKKGKMLSEKQKYDNYSYVISKMKQNGQNSMHLALARNRLSLSSIGKIEYTKKLLDTLKDKRCLIFCGLNKTAESLGICFYNSESAEDSSFMNFMDGKINHLALSGIGRSGVTFPNLDCVIMLDFSYNSESTSQTCSRALNMDYGDKIAKLLIVSLNEPPELKKLKESLSMLDQNKIKYV